MSKLKSPKAQVKNLLLTESNEDYIQVRLPFRTFVASASCLTDRDLYLQALHGWQLLGLILALPVKDLPHCTWKDHPTVKLWQNWPHILMEYLRVIHDERVSRPGGASTFIIGHCENMFARAAVSLASEFDDNLSVPVWLGNDAYHIAHRSNLIRLNPEVYRSRFPGTPENLPYVWSI